MLRKLLLLALLTVISCGTVNPDIIEVQQKLLAEKVIRNGDYYFKFYDGTILRVDYDTYHQFKPYQTVQLTWKRKK